MFSDYHVHSSFSFDSEASVEENIKKAIELNMKQLCITDHHEFYWPNPKEDATIDIDTYFSTLSLLKEKYKNQIDLLIGVELGLTDSKGLGLSYDANKMCYDFIKKHSFDFVIGSCHLVEGRDPWHKEFWNGKDDRQVFEQYFTEMLSILKDFHFMDTLGHLDFVARYSPNGIKNYSYFDYSDLFDEILKILIENDIKLEINTNNILKGFDFPNPHPDIIKRYTELGGRYVTIGSDAHNTKHIGSNFKIAEDIVNKFNLKVYTV